MNPHQKFIDYVRTLSFKNQIFRHVSQDEPIYISSKIVQKFFPYPRFRYKDELKKLEESGELEIVCRQKADKKLYSYKALKPGSISPSLWHEVTERGKELTKTHRRVMNNLLRASLPEESPRTPYFDAFLMNGKKYPEFFFRVDAFAGRVHTPVSNFKREYRPNLLIDGERTTSLDVFQMQPTLLGVLLHKAIGENQFSTWIENGEDVYLMLMKTANLANRDKGKKKFFQIVFGQPSDDLNRMFGSAKWINEVNQIKTIRLPKNPKSEIKGDYTNLAWLLQNYEVKIMEQVWLLLLENNIPFLTVHDEIIVKQSDEPQALKLFQSVLERHRIIPRIRSKFPSIQDEVTPDVKPEIKPPTPPAAPIDKPKLIGLAYKIIEGENNYSKEGLINLIKEATNVTPERAAAGFNLFLENGIINSTHVGRFYLAGSTPF